MATTTDPRRANRRRAMMDAAAELFMEKGYSATSLEDVVKRSGGSLKTLYDLFSNKHGLLRAIIEERCDEIHANIESAMLQDKPLREALRLMAECLFNGLSNLDSMALFRVIIAEIPRAPEIGQLFFAAGPDTGQRKVAGYLQALHDKGLLAVDDADYAAAMFGPIVFGPYLLQLLCGVPLQLSEAEKSRHLDRAVDAFMKIYTPAPKL